MVKEGDIEYGQGEAGLPDPCPSCGTLGYLQHINLRNATKTQRCPRCGRVWSTELSLRERQHAAATDQPRKWTLKQVAERSSSGASQAASVAPSPSSRTSAEPSESEPAWLARVRSWLRKEPRTAAQRAMWVDLQRLLRERDLLLKRADEATKFVIAELERADDDEQPRS